MAMQVSALTHQVYRLPQWSLADIYMDFASGAGIDNRSEFQRMINDCVNGKIEISRGKWIQTHFCEHGSNPLEIRHFAAVA